MEFKNHQIFFSAMEAKRSSRTNDIRCLIVSKQTHRDWLTRKAIVITGIDVVSCSITPFQHHTSMLEKKIQCYILGEGFDDTLLPPVMKHRWSITLLEYTKSRIYEWDMMIWQKQENPIFYPCLHCRGTGLNPLPVIEEKNTVGPLPVSESHHPTPTRWPSLGLQIHRRRLKLKIHWAKN